MKAQTIRWAKATPGKSHREGNMEIRSQRVRRFTVYLSAEELDALLNLFRYALGVRGLGDEWRAQWEPMRAELVKAAESE